MENKWGMHMKTSISEKIAYGMGDVACNVVYALTSGLIVYFLYKCNRSMELSL